MRALNWELFKDLVGISSNSITKLQFLNNDTRDLEKCINKSAIGKDHLPCRRISKAGHG